MGTSLTLAPFGALLYPNELTGEGSMQLFDDDEGGEWLAVHQRGWPIILRDSGETALSHWTFSSANDPAKLTATWIYDGQLRQGLRAQALRCDLMLTGRALRLGMSVGVLPKQGPWILQDATQKMVELKSHCVFAAILPYEDITMVDAGRNYVEINAGISSLSLVGKVKRDQADGRGQMVNMNEFTLALVDAIVTWCRESEDPKKIAAAERLADSAYVSDISRRGGAKVHLV